MTSRLLVAALLAITALAGCGGPTKHRVQVDSPMTPYKPADPEELVSSDDDDEENGAAKPGADEE